MRWTYIIPRLIIVGLLWGFLTYGVDPLLRYSTVTTFQSMTGAKVDVAVLTSTYFPPSFTIRGMAFASPSRQGKNIVEFDELHAKLEPHALSRRRFVIEDGHLDGLRFDTRRSDDGQLEITETTEETDPSWISEKLTDLGDEWLSNLEEQIRSQLDPNSLETYRVGTSVYDKWDLRFDELVARAKALEPRAKSLRTDFDAAKKGDTIQQIEQYLAVAQEAEQLVRDAQHFRQDLTGIVPEVRTDFQLLNEARLRDQEKVKHTLALLKPDARRIAESLLGETMYLRVQETLSWVELIREYQNGLHEQIQPPRRAGRDFEFWAAHRSPDFLLKNLRLTGTISVSKEAVPFHALLTDVTEDPVLLGRPCVLSLAADGSRPMRLKVTYDATTATPLTEMIAELRDTNSIPLHAGKPGKACLRAVLNQVSWQSRLILAGNQVDGQLVLDSQLDQLSFSANDDVRPEIVEIANQAFGNLKRLNATVSVAGKLTSPSVEINSDIGEQIASGVKVAFSQQLAVAKVRLSEEVNEYADEHIQTLKNRFAADYDRLVRENAELIEKASEVTTLVANIRSGNLNAASLARQVSNSRLINEKDREKINQSMEKAEGMLREGVIPAGIQKKLPGLPGNVPLPSGSLKSLWPGLVLPPD